MAVKICVKTVLHGVLVEFLSPIVQKTDRNFLDRATRLGQIKYYSQAIFKAMKHACDRSDYDILEYLLQLAANEPKPLYASDQDPGLPDRVNAIVNALKSGPKKNFASNAYIILVRILSVDFTGKELDEQIQRLFADDKSEASPRQNVIVPEGELLNMELSQRKAFRRKYTNFCVWYKEGNHVTLIYRDVNGSQHSIPIATTTDQSGAITQFSFGSESRATLSSLILHHSLSSLIFADYPHQLIAVTRELLSLPYEQQPWFRGILTRKEQFAAMESPSSFIFFTYRHFSEIRMRFTETIASEKKKKGWGYYDIVLHGEDISTHFPRDKLVLGLHNGGEINGLAEHLIWQAVFTNDLESVKRIVSEYNLDLKTSKFLNLSQNLVDRYAQESVVNADLLAWIIENGADLAQRKTYLFGVTVDRLIEKHDEKVLRALAPKIAINYSLMHKIIRRGVTYDTLTLCWKSYMPQSHEFVTLIGLLLRGVEEKKFKTVTYKNRTLIMTAWKFDKNCLFRKLPKEIVLEILSYDNIDEPPYWDFLDFVIKTSPAEKWSMMKLSPNLEARELVKFVPLVWKNWDEPSYKNFVTELLTALTNLQYESIPQYTVNELLSWTLKFVQRSEDPPKNITGLIYQYCLKTPSPLTLSILQEFIDKKILDYKPLSELNFFAVNALERILMPTMFFAVMTENTPALQLLIESNLWREDYDHLTLPAHGLVQLMQRFPDKKHVKKFIDECLQRKKKAKDFVSSGFVLLYYVRKDVYLI